MKKVYTSPEFELTRIYFENMLVNDLKDSSGEVGSRIGDDTGLDE